jgi:hypothetical protein
MAIIFILGMNDVGSIPTAPTLEQKFFGLRARYLFAYVNNIDVDKLHTK